MTSAFVSLFQQQIRGTLNNFCIITVLLYHARNMCDKLLNQHLNNYYDYSHFELLLSSEAITAAQSLK